jgi:hypothetical protein
MPLQLGIHEVQSQADLHQLLETAQSEQKRAVVVQAKNGLSIRVLPKQNAFVAFINSISNQTTREQNRLNAFRNSLPATHAPAGGQLAAAEALQNGINPTPVPATPSAPINPIPADAIEVADPAVAAHHKEALRAFTHRLSEALMFDSFYVQSVRKNIQKYGLEEYLKGTETFPNPDNTPHVLRLAEKSGPYEYYIAGRLQAIGLIQNKEDIWGVTNQDITDWYDSYKDRLNLPLTPEPIERPTEPQAQQAPPPTLKAIPEITPKSTTEQLAAKPFAEIFGAATPFTQNPQDIFALVQKNNILGKLSTEETEKQTKAIKDRLAKSGTDNLLAALKYIGDLKTKINAGLYIEAQKANFCGKHAMASFFGHAVFPTQKSFVDSKKAYVRDLAHLDEVTRQEMIDEMRDMTEGYMLEALMQKHIRQNPGLIPEHMRGKAIFSTFIAGRKRVAGKLDTSAKETARLNQLGANLLKSLNESPNKEFIVGDKGHWYTIKKHEDKWVVLDSLDPENHPPLDIGRLLGSVAGSNLTLYGLSDPTGNWVMDAYLKAQA